MNNEEKLKEAKRLYQTANSDQRYVLESLFPELKESEDKKIRKALIQYIKNWKANIQGKAYTYLWSSDKEECNKLLAWLEKQGHEPNWCHHKVDLSAYSEEYRKAYYDGWNNCNMQHSQCKAEMNDVVKCLINGMKFFYEDNKDATWGTDKWSMPVKHIIDVLEKQGEQNPFDYENANLQQKDFAPKATTANRQVYNRAILTILSNYVEKYPDIRFGQMLCNLDVNPHFDEESRKTYCNLNETINKKS